MPSLMPCGQITEPRSKLFDNQALVTEVGVDFSRESMTYSTNGSRNGRCFTIGAYLHHRRFTSGS